MAREITTFENGAYKLGKNERFVPVAASGVFANFALGDFIPVLSFYDSTGALISRAVAEVVKTGDAPEISWFPGVKPKDEAAAETNPMPWLLFQGNLAGFTVVHNAITTVPISGQLVAPLNLGGSTDDAVFMGVQPGGAVVPITGANEPYDYIQLTPGLYLIRASIGWFLDWGRCSVQPLTSVFSETAPGQMLAFDNAGSTMASTYFGFATLGNHQTAIEYEQVVSVSPFCTQPRVRVAAISEDGTSRTFNNTTRPGGMGLTIIRLSADPDSNPG